MEYRASHMYARISGRKVRPVVTLIRGLSVNQALHVLEHVHRRGAYLVRKVLKSALANAQQSADVQPAKLTVTQAVVDDGPLHQKRLRWRPAARGRVMPIRKRTSHIRIGLSETLELASSAEEHAPKAKRSQRES
ncbi:MAG: 50S ribosomal protein L22 [Planctomycetota bacterium]